jgi:hypothetical protein
MREFSYQDIVAITRTRRTRQVERLVDDGIEAGGHKSEPSLVTTQEVVQLNLMNGESVTLVLDDAYLTGVELDNSLPQSETDRIVETIRKLVRDKKNALSAAGSTSAQGAASTYDAAFSGR